MRVGKQQDAQPLKRSGQAWQDDLWMGDLEIEWRDVLSIRQRGSGERNGAQRPEEGNQSAMRVRGAIRGRRAGIVLSGRKITKRF